MSLGSTCTPGDIRILVSIMGRIYAASVRVCPATNGKIRIALSSGEFQVGIQEYGNPTEHTALLSVSNNNTLVDQYGDFTAGVMCQSASNIKPLFPVTKQPVCKHKHIVVQTQLEETKHRIAERGTKQQHENSRNENISYNSKDTTDWITVISKRGTKCDQT